MRLYRILFDAQPEFVEAADLGNAVRIWRQKKSVDWDDEYDGTEEPESIELLHDGPVLRDK